MDAQQRTSAGRCHVVEVVVAVVVVVVEVRVVGAAVRVEFIVATVGKGGSGACILQQLLLLPFLLLLQKPLMLVPVERCVESHIDAE